MNTIARRRGARSDCRRALATACHHVEALETRRLLAATIYVDANASGTLTGASWTNAFTDLQQALSLAVAGDTIRVADGIYKPTTGASRNATFQIPSGVTLEGSYAGATGPNSVNPDARFITTHPSILSGEIGLAGNNDNSFNIVTVNGTSATTVLDGFTIRDGNADGTQANLYDGAGLLIKGTSTLASSPLVRSCTFTSNTSSVAYGGGAIYAVFGNPIVSDCNFVGNTSFSGGAIFSWEGVLTVVRSTFTRNTASDTGGAIYNPGGTSQLAVTACSFNGNSAIEGGAIWVASAFVSPFTASTLTNCTFVGNRATGTGGTGNSGYGGAILAFATGGDWRSPRITNCTFVANEAHAGGGVYNKKGGDAAFFNSILWGNVARNGVTADSQIVWRQFQTTDPVINYCDVQGGVSVPGTGNINADPQVQRSPSPGTNGAWGDSDDDYGNLRLRLRPNTSPCIDAGNNADIAGVATDIAGELRIVDVPGVNDPGAIVDMGAYERRVTARGLYVDLNPGIATRNGAGWTTAFLEVQDALAIAISGDTIYVADGTYKPTTGTDRNATHQLVSGARMFGSYAGFGAANPDARNFITTASILSGAIAATIAGNSYHVVTGSGVSASTIVDGFTIRDGNANGTGANNGGGGFYNASGAAIVRNCTFTANSARMGAGMYNHTSSAAIVDKCTFTNNSASIVGGGIYNLGNSTTAIVNSTFTSNSAGNNGGGIGNQSSSGVSVSYCTFTTNAAVVVGGAISNNASSPLIRRSQFTENTVTNPGGGAGIFNSSSSPNVEYCTFTRNRTTNGRGGGVYNESSSAPAILGCRFNGNTAIEGGAIYNNGSSTPQLDNCTLVGNVATTFGGGVRNVGSSTATINNCTFADNFCVNGGGALSSSNASVTVTNSILWSIPPNDFPPVVQTGTGSTSITYSDVWNGYPGTGNISTDPLFVSNPSPGASGWGNADDDYGNVRLQRTSPCIDIGNNADVPATLLTDQDHNPRIVNIPTVNDPGAIVDMGAFERQIGVTVGSGIFDVNAALPSVRFTFDVQIDDDSLTADDLLVNFHGRPGTVSAVNVSYDPDTLTATFGLPATLPDGFYTATLPAGSVIDTAGDPLAADFSFDFFFLAGDANRDGTVNLADFNILAANFGQEPRTFGQGDFNYDGRVNLADFNILAGRFGTVLSADGVMRTSDERFSVLPSAARFSDRSISAAASATSLFDDSEDEVLNLS